MAEGRARRTWDHTASIAYVTANAFAKKAIPIHKFHPYLEKPQQWTAESHEEFCQQLLDGWGRRN